MTIFRLTKLFAFCVHRFRVFRNSRPTLGLCCCRSTPSSISPVCATPSKSTITATASAMKSPPTFSLSYVLHCMSSPALTGAIDTPRPNAHFLTLLSLSTVVLWPKIVRPKIAPILPSSLRPLSLLPTGSFRLIFGLFGCSHAIFILFRFVRDTPMPPNSIRTNFLIFPLFLAVKFFLFRLFFLPSSIFFFLIFFLPRNSFLRGVCECLKLETIG